MTSASSVITSRRLHGVLDGAQDNDVVGDDKDDGEREGGDDDGYYAPVDLEHLGQPFHIDIAKQHGGPNGYYHVGGSNDADGLLVEAGDDLGRITYAVEVNEEVSVALHNQVEAHDDECHRENDDDNGHRKNGSYG